MFTVFLVIQVIVTVALVGAILIQRSDSDGLGSLSGGGSANALMTGRGQASLLTRVTAVLATIFMINSLLLSIIVARSNDAVSIVDKVQQEDALSVPLADEVKPAAEAPVEAPVVAPAADEAATVPATEEAAPVVNGAEESAPVVPQQ